MEQTSIRNIWAKLYLCYDCHILWLITRKHWSHSMPQFTKCYCGGQWEELCILHREGSEALGFFERCGDCINRFLCASSLPQMGA